MTTLAIILVLCSIILFYRATNSRVLSAVFSIGVFSFLVLIGAYVVADYFTGSGIDESVIYHLTTGFEGAGLADFSALIYLSGAFLLLLIVFSAAVYKLSGNKNGKRNVSRCLAAILCLSVAMYLNPSISDLVQLGRAGEDYGTFDQAPDFFIDNQSLKFSRKAKSIVYLYLESVERTYFDQTLFPGLMPNLMALEQKALSFTNIQQVYATGWTIAGMTASQCGIPLVTAGHGNSMNGIDEFLPRATCLGDLLKGNGYYLSYMGGASLKFAGKGKLYATHKFDSVEGLDELVGGISDPDYQNPWGLYDDSLFALAKEKYESLASRKTPYGLFLLTLNTHAPDGHMPKSCGNLVYGDGSNAMLNAVHCADKLAGEFIRDMLNSKAFDNTLLVVASDHLAMSNSATETLKKGNRKNLLMVFGSDYQNKLIDRPGSTLDVGPTVLSMMGATINGHGFGRDLMKEHNTLVEESVPANNFLKQQKEFLASMWSYPNFTDGIRVNLKDKTLRIGNRTIRYPALFLFDEQASIKEIAFQFDSPKELISKLFTLNYDQRFLWIDVCAKVIAINPSVPLEGNAEHCAALGAWGSDVIKAADITGKSSLEKLHPTGFLRNLKIDSAYFKDRKQLRSDYALYDSINVIKHKQADGLRGHYVIRSAGGLHFRKKSYVLDASAGSPDRILLLRGITLMGFRDGVAPTKLAHVDSCAGKIRDTVGVKGPLKNMLDKYSGDYGAMALVVHDSARCNGYQFDFDTFFEGSGFKRWHEMGTRQPYIGIVSGDGNIAEYLGQRDSDFVVDAKNFIGTNITQALHKSQASATPPEKTAL